MSLDLNSTDLQLADDGIWYPKSALATELRFPKDGHQECLQIEDGSFWFEHRNNCLWEMVRRFPTSGPLLDVGGGNGFVAASMTRRGLDSILLEPGLEGAKSAKERQVASVVCATLEEAGFQDGGVPAIGLFDVLEHIERDHDFLSLVHRKLKPDGKLYITVPAYQFLWSGSDDIAGHCRRYTVSSLKRDLEANGFEVLFGSYLFSFLPLPILLGRTLLAGGWKPNMTTYKSEHGWGSGPTKWIKKGLCAAERQWLAWGLPIPFGSSCLVVAQPAKR